MSSHALTEKENACVKAIQEALQKIHSVRYKISSNREGFISVTWFCAHENCLQDDKIQAQLCGVHFYREKVPNPTQCWVLQRHECYHWNTLGHLPWKDVVKQKLSEHGFLS